MERACSLGCVVFGILAILAIANGYNLVASSLMFGVITLACLPSLIGKR